MTSTVSGLLPLGMMLASADAAVVVNESIDYADEAAFDDAFLFENGGNQFNPTGLTHPGLTGESGGRAEFKTDRIKQSFGQTFGTSDGTLYVSMLMQSTSTASVGGGLFRTLELYDSSIGGAGIEDGDSEWTYTLGFLRGRGNTSSTQFEHVVAGNSSTPDMGLVNTDVNLFVMKFNFSGGDGSAYTVDSWLNPDVGTTDFDSESNRISGTGLQFDYFGFASFADDNNADPSSPADFDEFRAGTSIDDLGLVPEPSSSFLIGFGAVSFLLRRKRR